MATTAPRSGECTGRPPSLRRWLPLAYDVVAHAGLADIDAEFEQFLVDAWRTPKRIFTAHFADQFSHVFGNRRSARLTATNFPGPKQPEALAVPGNDGFRFDDTKADRQ